MKDKHWARKKELRNEQIELEMAKIRAQIEIEKRRQDEERTMGAQFERIKGDHEYMQNLEIAKEFIAVSQRK